MREHIGLYRGKRVGNGEWVQGYLYEHEPPLQCFVPEGYVPEKSKWYILKTAFADWNMPRQVEFIEVDPDTVGECCGGLTDKNGKLAFEHDVTEDQWGRLWIIFGCKGGFGICRDTEWTRNADCSVITWNALAAARNAEWFSKQHEIIGNIHDNPELLGGGDESHA